MPMMAPPLFQWHADSRASMTDAGGNIFDMFGDGGAGSAGALDAMLEVLPEDVDAPFGMGVGSNNSTTGAGAGAGTGAGEHHIGYSNAQPIDVANHQNGEIAQLWDFNVDEFMMTPSGSSDSATISAPNSFNSEQHASVPGNWGPLLGAAFPADLAPQPLFQAPPALPADLPLFRPTLPTRRSSSQLSKALADDGAVPLASAATANSVRKSSVTRPLSSSSLSSYRQNSLSELPKKPQVQCFNCKTFKTPLWRRDAQGNTMCNACGLFQKLHGTMRPLSLKSDVIRKRNTKKRGKKTDTKDTTAKNAAPAGAPPSTTAASTTATSDRDVPLPATPTISTSKTNSSTNLSVNGTFTTSNTQLNSNVLMNHNRRMLPSAGVSKKSRRSSSSSSASNSSNRSSSSRSMVPILPKPSPGATASSTSRSQSQVTSFPSSAGNSAASSPRYSNSPRPASATSPLPTSNGNQLSSSGGRPGVTIVRRKSSRQTMNSSSFMAASLQQHQQHMNFQSSNPVGSSSSTISAHSVSWNSNGISAPSPNSGRSPRSPFDLFSSSQEPHSRPASRKQHTSLLSQQLQQATASPQYPQSPSQFQTFPSNGNSTSATPQPVSIKRSPITASPRNSYMDSIQQQRGVPSENSVRRTTSLRSEANNSVSGITTNAQNSHKHKEGFMEDLEWLKFGL